MMHGNGAGLLNDQTATGIAHFRPNVTLMSWKVQSVWAHLRLQVGFARGRARFAHPRESSSFQ